MSLRSGTLIVIAVLIGGMLISLMFAQTDCRELRGFQSPLSLDLREGDWYRAHVRAYCWRRCSHSSFLMLPYWLLWVSGS